MLRTEQALDAEVMAAIRAPFDAFGGAVVDAPVLQPLSLLLDLAGEGMRTRLFVVQGEGAEEQALRPDFTIPVVQTHIASGALHGRYRYEGKAFLVAERGSHHPAEFLQIGAELFGLSQDPCADDAAVAALAWSAASAGGRDDLSMRLGDPGLFSGFLTALGLPETASARLRRSFHSVRALHAELERASAAAPEDRHARLADLLGGLPEEEASGVLEELWRLSGIQPVGGRSAAEIVQRLSDRAEAARAPRLTAAEKALIERFLQLSDEPARVLDGAQVLAREAGGVLDPLIDSWTRRLKALDAHGVPMTALTLSTAHIRPFGYYDGMLFEILSASLEADQPVAGGGRYDGVPARMGGKPGAVGCMVRPSRAVKGAAA